MANENVNTKVTADQSNLIEEEEGEIKDDGEENETNFKRINVESSSTASIQKIKNDSNTIRENKKVGRTKKRKLDKIKTEPIQEQDDIDNSTLAKRKKM